MFVDPTTEGTAEEGVIGAMPADSEYVYSNKHPGFEVNCNPSKKYPRKNSQSGLTFLINIRYHGGKISLRDRSVSPQFLFESQGEGVDTTHDRGTLELGIIDVKKLYMPVRICLFLSRTRTQKSARGVRMGCV